MQTLIFKNYERNKEKERKKEIMFCILSRFRETFKNEQN